MRRGGQSGRTLTAEDIVVLSALETIRRRPKMFLGRVDVAAMVEVVVADIIDSDGGTYTRIEVSVDRRARTVRVIDDDAGWREAYLAPDSSHIERLACELFAGRGPSPRGMGALAMINALSEQLELRVAHPVGGYAQRFVMSDPEPPMRSPGTAVARTETTFTPRRDMFAKGPFPNLEDLARRLRKRVGEAAHVGVASGTIIVARPLVPIGSSRL